MLGSNGYDNERPSEQDSSIDNEFITDSKLTKEMFSTYRVKNDVDNGYNHKILVFSTSIKGNGITRALAKDKKYTNSSLVDYKEAFSKGRA